MKFICTDKNNDISEVSYTRMAKKKKKKERILSPRVPFHSSSVTNLATLFSRKN